MHEKDSILLLSLMLLLRTIAYYMQGFTHGISRLTKHSTRCARHYVLSIVKLSNVLTNVCPTDTDMALHTHVVSNGQHNLIINIIPK